jgi:hypothetical protein
MTARKNPTFPAHDFGLLLVEGGDERVVCETIAGPQHWNQLVCWNAQGRTSLPSLAQVAALEPNIRYARSIGVVLDAEDSVNAAAAIAQATLAALGHSGAVQHGVLLGTPPAGVFISPDGVSAGAIETLCRRAVRSAALAACVDSLLACAGTPHAAGANPAAREDKGWLRAYLAMHAEPELRFYQSFTTAIDPTHVAFDSLRTFLRAL